MNQTLKVSLIVVGTIVLIALVFGAGLLIGRWNWSPTAYTSTMPMDRADWGYHDFPQSRMGGYRPFDRMGRFDRQGGMGMMGNYRYNLPTDVEPLTVEQTTEAVEGYLTQLNNDDLVLDEIMIFDNNAYARIIEKSTGIGAMELLVDPVSLAVFPEYGPNMMWNLKFGHMHATGMMGGYRGMRGYQYTTPYSASDTMTVSPEEASDFAQEYLDRQLPGSEVAEDVEQFYGYYTIDILKDGQPTGMLSVNGFTGQVFLHTWHSTFIEMPE